MADDAGEDLDGPHGATDGHGTDHGDDAHDHAEPSLGPVDVQRWGAAAAGVLLGLVVVVALMQSLG